MGQMYIDDKLLLILETKSNFTPGTGVEFYIYACTPVKGCPAVSTIQILSLGLLRMRVFIDFISLPQLY